MEGSELKAISQWISSGILENVRQIGIEIHTAKDFVGQDQVAPVLLELIDDLQKLYEMGFRLISSTNNGCSDKGSDLEQRYNPFFELVFYKPWTIICKKMYLALLEFVNYQKILILCRECKW